MTHAEYPKVVYTATGQALLLPDASAARELPDGPWFDDPEGREPVAVVEPELEPELEPEEAPAEPVPAKPRSHKKAAKD